MAPSVVCGLKKCSWFYRPWLLKIKVRKNFAFIPLKKLVKGKDGDSKCMENWLTVNHVHAQAAAIATEAATVVVDYLEDDIVDNGLDQVLVLESKVRDAIARHL